MLELIQKVLDQEMEEETREEALEEIQMICEDLDMARGRSAEVKDNPIHFTHTVIGRGLIINFRRQILTANVYNAMKIERI